METPDLHIERVPLAQRERFFEMAKDYWHDLMPRSDIFQSRTKIQAYFEQTFTWKNGNQHPYWALSHTDPVGFMSFELASSTTAYVHDFYIASSHRRKGYGKMLVHWLFAHLDALGIERLDLNVRRDTPHALAFWEAQGFGIAGYSLRMYRNPKTGTAYKDVLSSDFDSQQDV